MLAQGSALGTMGSPRSCSSVADSWSLTHSECPLWRLGPQRSDGCAARVNACCASNMAKHQCRFCPASYQFVLDAANGRCTDTVGLLRISPHQPSRTPMSTISLGSKVTGDCKTKAALTDSLGVGFCPYLAFHPTYRSGAASRDVSNRLSAAAASFKSASKSSGGLPSSSIPLKVA